MANKKYNFGEKEKEYDAKTGQEIPVWQSPKYLESKEKVIEILESKKYDELTESDFWILMNKTKTNKCRSNSCSSDKSSSKRKSRSNN